MKMTTANIIATMSKLDDLEQFADLHDPHHTPDLPPRVAWTGGSSPQPYAKASTTEHRVTHQYYIEQLQDYRAGWHSEPDADTRAIFWNRARHDAHATCRAMGV